MLGPLPHPRQTKPVARRAVRLRPEFKTDAVIVNLEVQRSILLLQSDPSAVSLAVARGVVERFLDDAIEVDGILGRNGVLVDLGFEIDRDARLPLELPDEPVQRLLQPEVIQNRWAKHL